MPLSKLHYQRLATLREALRRFLHFSQNAAEREGLTPQQHQAILALKGSARGSLSVGELAEQLYAHHHSAVGLVDRLARQKLVRRLASSTADRRRVELRLTARGEALIDRLSRAHWLELQQFGPELRSALDDILTR